MLKKDGLYKKYLLRRDQISKKQYHKIRNMYFHLIKLKKQEFYQTKFKNFSSNVKKTWQYINSLLGRTLLNSATSSFFINGKKTCDPLLIANEVMTISLTLLLIW